MNLLQAAFTIESALEINGQLIVKNGFSILITSLHHTIVSFLFFIDLF